ncbi:MAG: hypothetical protein FJX11_23370 [Alphaproteobacteria bacterium]|nr:hypothetical protein [Alphaproteobacteria bacterium]
MVYPANADLITAEASWPAAAKAIRTTFLDGEEGKTRATATPRFILVQDGKIVLTVTGNAGWKDKMWPKIAEMTGTKA